MNKWDKRFTDLALMVSTWSYCKKLQVGSVLVKDSTLISLGYNGTLSGFDNVCECEGETLPHVLHSESNTILQCVKNGIVIPEGSTLYCTHFPCYNCAKIIVSIGRINRLVYINDYKDNKSKVILTNLKIEKWNGTLI